MGKSFTYRADAEKYTGPIGDDLIVANGMSVTVLAVFADWNEVEGLEILAVRVPETGHTTHVTPGDLGLESLDSP